MADGPELRGEDKLNDLFANKVMHSSEFRGWLIAQTKFACLGTDVRILDELEYMIRPRRFWWRHWWCGGIPGCGEKETDIFLVFENLIANTKFAIHIENKLKNGKFTQLQAECYGARAKHMMHRQEFLGYADFETMLIAPLSFNREHATKASLFDRYVSYEEIARFIPEFGS